MANSLLQKINDTLQSSFPSLEVTTSTVSADVSNKAVPLVDSPSTAQPVFTQGADGSYCASIPVTSIGTVTLSGHESHEGDGRMYYEMAQHLIRLICEQESYLQQILLQSNDVSSLLNHLFHPGETDLSYVSMSALHHGYNMAIPRYICLLQFHFPQAQVHTNAEIMASALITIKRMNDMTEQEMVGQISGNQLVICKTFSRNADQARQYVETFLLQLQHVLENQFSISVQISVGGIVDDIHQYADALTIAIRILELAEKFNRQNRIQFLEDYLPEYEMTLVPRPILDHFFKDLSGIVDASPWMFDTLEALVANNMDQKNAAASLYIHKNTLTFRLRKIYECLQLDPYAHDSDRFTLIALYYYMVLYSYLNKHTRNHE